MLQATNSLLFKTFTTFFVPQIRVWRGQAPVAMAFWGHGVFVSLVIVAAWLDALYRRDAITQQAMLTLFPLYTAWVLAAIWRCAAATKEPWGMITRLLTIAWAGNTLMVVGFLQFAMLPGA